MKVYKSQKQLQQIIKCPEQLRKISDNTDQSRIIPNQNATILKLSDVVLSMIYQGISHPQSQASFAITCKHFLSIASLSSLNIGCWLTPEQKYYYGQDHLALDLRKWNFIPEGLQLCYSCWKYLPRNRIWKDRQGRELRHLRRVDWIWAVKEWMDGGVKCPTCQIPEGYNDSDQTSWVQVSPKRAGSAKLELMVLKESCTMK